MFASLQNIHEIEKEFFFSFKDAKSRWGVMILMNFSTCQFENVQRKQMERDDGFVYTVSFNDSKLQIFPILLLKVGIAMNNRQSFNMKHYQA